MATIKTAISLQETLFTQVEELAAQLRVSRSQLVAMALEDFVQRHQNQRLLAELNQAYNSDADAAESRQSAARRQKHRRIVEGEW